MVLLNLKDQRDIAAVIEYLVEIHHKNNTVEDVMKKFGLSLDQYRMCCNLAMPALSQGNMKGRFTAVSRTNRYMRKDIKRMYEAVKDQEGPGVECLKMLYEDYCVRAQSVVYGSSEEEGAGTSSDPFGAPSPTRS